MSTKDDSRYIHLGYYLDLASLRHLSPIFLCLLVCSIVLVLDIVVDQFSASRN